jgi:uncharacterized membrane protein YuzA (DUF378 family)
MRLVDALVTGLVGFIAFNMVDGVFGLATAILGLAACIATTVCVVWRSPPPEDDSGG